MMGSREENLWGSVSDSDGAEFDNLVLSRLSKNRQLSAEEISDQVSGSVPWDVLMSCRRLCRRGSAEEGHGDFRGRFKLR
jgi:hypothetical protein